MKKSVTLLVLIVFAMIITACSDYTPVEAGNEYRMKLSGAISDSTLIYYYTYEKGMLKNIRYISDGSDETNEYIYDDGKVIRYKEDFTTTCQTTDYYYNKLGLIEKSILTSFDLMINKIVLTSETKYEYDEANRIIRDESKVSYSNKIFSSEVMYNNDGNVIKLVNKENGHIVLTYCFEYDSCKNPYYEFYPFSDIVVTRLSKNNMIKQSAYFDDVLLAEANYNYKYNAFRYPTNCIFEIKNFDADGNCIEREKRYRDYYY